MAADRITLAQPAPAHCSSCYQQKPEQAHVDFGAGYDGPVVPALEGTVGVVGHMIDELILCSDCIKTAARLIGLDDVREVMDRLETVEYARNALHDRLEAAEAHIERLTATIASKDQLEAVKRPGKIVRSSAERETLKRLAEQQAPAKPKRQSAAAKAAAAEEEGK